MSPFVTLLLVILALPWTVARAQDLSDGQRRQVDSVFASIDGTGRPGCSVGIGRGGKPVFLKGYGMSDLQHRLAITPGSIFHVASVSKQFAAFAVALLAEDGKLSLDDPVQKHIPEVPDYGTPVTIRQLIYHTSGIRDHWELLGLAGWRYPVDLFTQQDVLEIVSRQKALNFRPNDEYLYSNAGYALLAMVVERVSGKSLKQFSEERIFAPLGMKDTHVHDDHAHVVVDRTSAYQRGPGGEWKISIPQFDTHGATSLFTTAADLLKWEHNFVTGTVGSRALLTEAETSSILNNGKPSNYGFGISVGTYRGARTTGHGGADAGYRADLLRFPDHNLDVAVLCNYADAVPSRFSRAIASIVLGDQLEPEPVAEKASGTATAADLARAAGIYRDPAADRAVVFEVKDGKLVLVNFGNAALEPLGPTRFTVFGVVAEFFGPAGQPAESARLSSGGTVIDSLVRATVWNPSKAELEAIVGQYWSSEVQSWYRIETADSGLVLKRPKNGPMPMRPAFADVFMAGSMTIRVVRQGRKVTGFLISGGRVRNVSFSRGTPGS